MTSVWPAESPRSGGAGHHWQAAALLQLSVCAQVAWLSCPPGGAGLLSARLWGHRNHSPPTLPAPLSVPLIDLGSPHPHSPCGRLVLRLDLGQGCQPGSDTCRRTHSTSLGSSSVQWVSSGTGARAATQVPGLEQAGAVPTGRSGPAWSAGQREHPGSRKERQV